MIAMFSVKYVPVLLVIKFCCGLEEGDICSLADGNPGICKLISNCPSGLASIKSNVFPITCGFRDTQIIVCCESSNEIESTSTPTTTETYTKASFQPTEIHTPPTPSNRRTGEISEQKCLEYAQYAYEEGTAPVLSRFSHRVKTLECSYEKLKLIVGGTLATRREFPHMVLIGYQTGSDIKWDCGGSLISEYFVLTAAHCLGSNRTFLGLAKFVKVGITNITDHTHSQERTVSQVIFHPDYKRSEKYYDIGLLKLSEKIEFDTYSRPACLHTVREISTEKAIACGWGNVGYMAQRSKDLLKIVLEFFDIEKCNKTYKSRISELRLGVLDDSMVCAGSTIDERNTCEGDSGGPLQVYHGDTEEIKCMYTIVGVTSFGTACGLRKDRPGIYTRVYAYLKWIEDIVWPV